MYREIVIPTYDLVLLVIAAGLIGFWLGKLIEEWLKDVLDDEIFETREEALVWVEKMRKKYGKVH